MMMAAEKKIDWFTSARRIGDRPRTCRGSPIGVRIAVQHRRPRGPMRRGSAARWRKMFSTMITVASTTRPKSIAPTDSRFADSPRSTMSPIAKDSANGMVTETMTALRRLPRKTHCSRKIRTMPATMLCSTVCVVTWIRSLRS